MIACKGYAAKHIFGKLGPFEFERQEAASGEIEIEVLFCGVCHSDIHQVKNEWMNTVYPCLPGHEIVGKVTKCGANAVKYKVGDLVGVGCMMDSCRQCEACLAGDENCCHGPNSWLATYNGPMISALKADDKKNHYPVDNTFGGYSDKIVIKEDFVLKIPEGMNPAEAAPLLCAGITTYSPLRNWDVKTGDRVGIVGLGGLGHIAARLAKAMGAHVIAFTHDSDKIDEAANFPDIDQVISEKDKESLKNLKMTFDFILDTVPEKHDINPYIPLLKRQKAIAVIGAIGSMPGYNNLEVVSYRRQISGSLIGSIKQTQEALDFCAEAGVKPDIKIIDIREINNAYKRVEKGDVRFRYVIDMATLNHN